jgi:hypothetical protein
MQGKDSATRDNRKKGEERRFDLRARASCILSVQQPRDWLWPSLPGRRGYKLCSFSWRGRGNGKRGIRIESIVGPVTVESAFQNAIINEKAGCQLLPCYCKLPIELHTSTMCWRSFLRLLKHALTKVISLVPKKHPSMASLHFQL